MMFYFDYNTRVALFQDFSGAFLLAIDLHMGWAVIGFELLGLFMVHAKTPSLVMLVNAPL
jgi:hypothetical protein